MHFAVVVLSLKTSHIYGGDGLRLMERLAWAGDYTKRFAGYEISGFLLPLLRDSAHNRAKRDKTKPDGTVDSMSALKV